MIFNNKPPLSKTDKLFLIGIAGVLITVTLIYEATDGKTIREAEAALVDKPPAITIAAPPIDCTLLVEAVEARREELFWESVPLDQECRNALQEACDAHGVPVCLALGVIHEESRFDPDADNGLSYGYTGLNKKYFPSDLTPAENIQAGVAYLGELLGKYDGDTAAALRSYNLGHDDGDRQYAGAVFAASEKWGVG